ncbi:sulfotransferase domain-containing protein [Actomonas aquatica]|uniref:Sulfotransferase domain-containing protein n=1 Tax=Actomonas aquatica TaxID=2866162 RepID=A0ABZ1CAF6_9BACT|nr:sulfotransferase domain-containing protein [Opitutus sp. WL0086]WRQ88456.1 sulfotransferase domain-containing protein [Opitutus sp. WL0086]
MNPANPNLFIVGAAKCGTTSIAAMLAEEAEVFLPRFKEPSPFAEGLPYQTKFPDPYLDLFAGKGDHRYRLDASTCHLSTPWAAQEIQRHFPESRIIIMLRNPVRRAYSLYNWMRREGYEPCETFAAALAAEAHRREAFREFNPQYYWNYLYRESGLYCDQVKRYLELFPKERVHVIFLDAPDSNDGKIIAGLEAFLGLQLSANSLPRLNEAQGVRSARLSYALRHQFQKPGTALRPIPGKGRLIRWLQRVNKSGRVPRLDGGIARELSDYYRADVIALGNLLQRPVDHWLR